MIRRFCFVDMLESFFFLFFNLTKPLPMFEPMYLKNSLWLGYSFPNYLQWDYGDLLSHGINVMFLKGSHICQPFPVYFLYSIYQNVKYMVIMYLSALLLSAFPQGKLRAVRVISDWVLSIWLTYFKKCVIKECMNLWETFVRELGFI